ncbi:DUF6602 domain-containing protein [Rhizobium sp. 25PS6]|uniref:DUF6602 domain-containing protein n=1 Tax=Rhizobium sp. 25PS6 TaxID=3075622 RepID=UPI0028FD25EB|nr:DUF6602 domain-containing protein [Rhizobium sp. 25PS6]MDU0364285.1 DUF6602 domain-containing protein [Rhizobium sp. 25PS6]
MIRSIGEMLEELRQAEAVRLDESDIRHAPTIGAMYEGLTKDILNRAIPDGLDLRIVSGFVVDGSGGSSGQIDCMLVRGEGVPVPFVDGLFQWHVRDVLVVFEVKKNLFAPDLSDAYDQLLGVASIFSSWIQTPGLEGEFKMGPSLRVFSECTGMVVPSRGKWPKDQRAHQLIWHAIMTDQIAPLRVTLGYGGYSTESGLRKGFTSFLGANLNKQGFGPPSLPNLIVGDGVSLVKLSGHPWYTPVGNDGFWPILASSHVNPTYLILELIWTRISYSNPVSAIFGSDLELERLAPLLDARPQPAEPGSEKWGWVYHVNSFTPRQLKGADFDEWTPVVLDDDQNAVVTILCGDDIAVTDPRFREFLLGKGHDPETFIEALCRTTLVARDGDILQLTTKKCEVVLLPDGRYVAADNNTGRLTRWVEKYMAQRRTHE